MGVQFNADEVFQIAEQIERNGAKFYRKAAQGAAEEAVCSLFTRLGAMEDEHERTFAAMRAGLPAEAKTAMVFDPDNEAAAYLEALANGYVFDIRSDASEALTGGESLAEVLEMAICREKESVVFYAGLRQVVPDDAGKGQLDRIINEELGHVAVLGRELAAQR